MPLPILNFGSLNIDHVYSVGHVVRPGETLASHSYQVHAGGKGANQSAALALAGAPVFHAGRVGADGRWLLAGLAAIGVDVSHVVVDEEHPTGHAVIQVEEASGENAIFLFPGCNRRVEATQVSTCIEFFRAGDILLLQNEISEIPRIIRQAANRGLTVCLNPAPFSPEVAGYPLDLVDLLVVNQVEASGLAGLDAAAGPDADELLAGLRQRLRPQTEVLLTLGAAGAVLDGAQGRIDIDAVTAGGVVDTTAAGDTFIGYFLASRVAGDVDAVALRRAAAAAGVCVTRRGARASIPRRDEVDSLLTGESRP